MSIPMNSDSVADYLTELVDRVYKILPLFEEKNQGLFHYVQSLIFELHGLYWAVDSIKGSGKYLILIATLESISDYTLFCEEKDHAVIKREVFKCLEVIKKIKASCERGG